MSVRRTGQRETKRELFSLRDSKFCDDSAGLVGKSSTLWSIFALLFEDFHLQKKIYGHTDIQSTDYNIEKVATSYTYRFLVLYANYSC